MINLDVDLSSLYSVLADIEAEYKLQSDLFTEETAYKILEESKKLCPVDTGRLRDSGKVVKDGLGYRVFYDCDYAFYVHEDMSKLHKIGTAKFLDLAVLKVIRGD